MMERRTFLQTMLAASAYACASGPRAVATRPKKKILILGGTGFIGPAIVEVAREHGHTVTLFNRGKTNPGMFTDIEQLRGDRDGKLDALKGRTWDAVIDDAGYVPRVVQQSVDLLKDAVGQYLFVSTISVYQDESPVLDESRPRQQLAPEDAKTEEVMKHYGALKAACEDTVTAAYGARALLVRPGLIVGPRDPTDRFSYWPVRLDQGGTVLAPGDGSDPVEMVDVRDLAAFIIELVEQGGGGTYHAAGPGNLTMFGMLQACQQATPAKSELVWVPWPFLEKQKVAPWSDMPVWVPLKEAGGLSTLSPAAAVAKGLRFRPIFETARDTLAWWHTLAPERRAQPMKAGISAAREAELLAAFRKA
jgi:2'-hydroxyisoflavone reductase